MRRSHWLGAIVILYIVISACTTLSKDECQRGNWFKIGQDDGIQGHPLPFIDNHIKACAKYGFSPNRRNYVDGRNFGLARYCTSINGFKAGRYSKPYHNVCPPETHGEFIKGYDLGRQFGQVENQLGEVIQDIVESENSLSKKKIGPGQKQRLTQQIDRLENEKIRLEKEIRRIQLTANKTL